MVAASRRYRNALTRTLRATGLANVPEEALLVETLRDLAKQLDEGAGSRVLIVWLSATKDLRRALSTSGGRVQGTAEPAAASKRAKAAAAAIEALEEDTAPVPNDLARFKAQRGIVA